MYSKSPETSTNARRTSLYPEEVGEGGGDGIGDSVGVSICRPFHNSFSDVMVRVLKSSSGETVEEVVREGSDICEDGEECSASMTSIPSATLRTSLIVSWNAETVGDGGQAG
jgi:hypothetical protein